MGKYDFLFSTPQNSYLDQALPPISAAPQLAAPQTVAARPQLSNEMMMALTGRNMTRPMSLPISKPRRPYSGAMPMSKPAPQRGGYSGPLPMSKPQRGYSGPLPMSKPAMPAAPQQQAAPQGFLEGLLGSGFDDPRTQGIMAASAALLEGGGPVVGAPAPSLGQSIGRAFNAYNTGRMGAEDRISAQTDRDFNKRYKELQMKQMEKSLNRPKVTSIAGGAYRMIENPDGTMEVVPNEGVQEALLAQRKAMAEVDANIATSKARSKNPLELSGAEKELDKVMAKKLPEKEQALADWPATKKVLEDLKGKIDGGFFTGLLSETDATSTMLNPEEEKARNFLKGLAQKLAKARNGARVTDADVRNAERSIPGLYQEAGIFSDTVDRLVLEFELAEAQAKSERDYLKKNKTFRGYEAPQVINGVIVRKQ